MDFALTEQQELIKKEVGALARTFPPDYWLEKDRKHEYPWEFVKAFGVTEPNAGTDTSRIQTFAEQQGERFIVNGRKVWNTNARQATHMLLLARTAPRDPAKPFRGLTLFFTPFDRSKITVREIEKLGRAAVDSNEIFIDGLAIAVDDVVGEVGQGFYHLLDSLNPERIMTAIEAVG